MKIIKLNYKDYSFIKEYTSNYTKNIFGVTWILCKNVTLNNIIFKNDIITSIKCMMKHEINLNTYILYAHHNENTINEGISMINLTLSDEVANYLINLSKLKSFL